MKQEDITTINFRGVEFPKSSPWECELFGGSFMRFRPRLGEHPNWFWRWMQYLAFGNKWVYRPLPEHKDAGK
jgi:hypothetical protein